MGTERYDIAIVGGGLIGSAAALALSASGFRVALAEPVPEGTRRLPDFDGRAYAVAPGSANLLRVLGVWPAIAPLASPVRRITVADTCHGPVPPAALHFDPAEGTSGDALGWIVEDRHLRGALIDALDRTDVIRLDGADARVAAFENHGATIRMGEREGLAALVIACDGRRSATARAAGIRYLGWAYGQTGLVSAISHEHPHDGAAHQSFFTGGPFAVLPLLENRSALVWSERTGMADRLRALDDTAYLAEVARRIGGRLGQIEATGRRWAYPLGLALATRFAAPRLMLAGDAAHGVHPIAGQGLNMGLRDVAAMTEVATEAARRGEDIGSDAVTARYEQWRRFDATALSLGMDGLNRLFSTGSAPLQALRNLGLGLVSRSGPARRLFMAEASGTAGTVPRLLTGQPL